MYFHNHMEPLRRAPVGNSTAYHKIAFSRHPERLVPDDGEQLFLIKHEISINDEHCVLLSIMIS